MSSCFGASRWVAEMAENEYLDSSKARRWQSVVQAIREMKRQLETFAVHLGKSKSAEMQEFTAGKHFRLRHDVASHDLMLDLPLRMVDLMRLASAVYFVDRISKRQRNGGADRRPRRLSCSIEVKDAAFWNKEAVHSLVIDALQFVTGDTWDLVFTQDASPAIPPKYPLLRANSIFGSPPVICLYSGGLDSAAGLARRLGDGISTPLVPVVVRHRTDIAKKVTDQIERLGRVFRTELRPVCAAMSMASPKRIARSEESSQRGRGFLFVSVGGAVAAATDASVVELYESGVGAINVPLLAGMEGSQATRSAHPTFLRKMSQLLSVVADRPIEVKLPYWHLTKRKLVCSLNRAELRELARETVSCVSFPLRHRTRKCCGVCAACLFRRVALHAAGIDEPGCTYQSDVLNQSSVASPKLDEMNGCQWANLIDLPPKAA